jgi:copper ion binding protein
MLKQNFTVSDMHCSNCVMRIESLEDNLPGVRSVSASYKKAQVVVEFDENQLSAETIVQAIRKLGYTASLVS